MYVLSGKRCGHKCYKKIIDHVEKKLLNAVVFWRKIMEETLTEEELHEEQLLIFFRYSKVNFQIILSHKCCS